jgi:CBS domain-containing protein
VDPLETTFVRDVMRTNLVVLPADLSVRHLGESLRDGHRYRGQRLYPVVDSDNRLYGVVTATELDQALAEAHARSGARSVAELVRTDPLVAFPDEPLRAVAYRMAETGLTRLPVVERGDERRLAGMLGLRDMLHARARTLEEEQQRERVLRLRRAWPRRARVDNDGERDLSVVA